MRWAFLLVALVLAVVVMSRPHLPTEPVPYALPDSTDLFPTTDNVDPVAGYHGWVTTWHDGKRWVCVDRRGVLGRVEVVDVGDVLLWASRDFRRDPEACGHNVGLSDTGYAVARFSGPLDYDSVRPMEPLTPTVRIRLRESGRPEA